MKHQIISRVRQPDHIHTHGDGDGRGSRQVYIDGVLCSRVVKADTQAGTVEVVTNPVTVDLETGHITEAQRAAVGGPTGAQSYALTGKEGKA